MSSEKMSPEKMRDLAPHPDFGPGGFPADAGGCRYDPRIREILTRAGRKVDPGTEALAAVRMLGKKMHMMMERWADHHGLSEGRFQILIRLQHVPGGRTTMGELAEMLDVSPRTVTGLVDNLERDGLVRRVDDPKDRRSVYAELTDLGRERMQVVWRDATRGQEKLTRNFKESELVQLRDISLRLIEGMAAEEGTNHAS